jgi:hypothetical protein
MPFPNPATQFKPGQSGNPKGRPPDHTAPILRRGLNRTLSKDLRAGELMAVNLLRQALGGNLKALRIVLDRTEGKVR